MSSTVPAANHLNVQNLCNLGTTRLAKILLERAHQDRELYALLNGAMRQVGDAAPTFTRDQAGPEEDYMVGSSPAMCQAFERIRRYAASDAPVLITGESGTGKELAAKAIHERSTRASKPIVAINCGALPSTLIASELFGYEKGAFTGAVAQKIGRIEAAAGGTILLDEIGDLPLETQTYLLRFLQEKTIERVGGHKTIEVDVRVIAATNVDLPALVEAGKFREDLFYRLNVLDLKLPPLRERGGDIMLIATFLLRKFAAETGRTLSGFDASAQRALLKHGWPGNVRELIACVRRGTVVADGPEITAEDLGLHSPVIKGLAAGSGLDEARAQIEASLLKGVLDKRNHNIKEAASELGVSRVTLYRLIQKHNIKITRRPRSAAVAMAAQPPLPGAPQG